MWIVQSDSDEGCPFPDFVNRMGIIYHFSLERLSYMSILADGKCNRFCLAGPVSE